MIKTKIEITFDWGLCKLCRDKRCKEIENCSHLSLYKFGFYSIMIGFSILMLKIYLDLIDLIESISGLIMVAGLIAIFSASFIRGILFAYLHIVVYGTGMAMIGY